MDEDYGDPAEPITVPLYYEGGLYSCKVSLPRDTTEITVEFEIGYRTSEETQAYVTEILRTMKERQP